MVGFQASVSDFSIPRICHLLLCTIPHPPFYSNLHRSYYTSSYAHLGDPPLKPRIYVYHTRSFNHLGISCLCPRMPTSQPTLPLPSGSYCMAFSPQLLLLLSSRELARVVRSCFSIAPWYHQASLLRPTPSYSVSLSHASNSGLSSTHCSTVAYRLPM